MKKFGQIGFFVLALAIIGLLAVALMMFGARLGLWEPLVGFLLYINYLNPIGYVLSALGVGAAVFHIRRRQTPAALAAGLALVIGLACLTPMIMNTVLPGEDLPPIHDITTDTANPPVFLALDDSRPGAKNTLVYGGAEIAEMQLAAYPDIGPIKSDLGPEAAYERALSIARDAAGWDIVAANADSLRFEASTTTPVLYFTDDIVVVVGEEGEASRIDVRSVSRIGRGDRGVNAERIRKFRDAFEDQ